MTKTKALYGFLCALAVVLGLFPSFYLNVKPWWNHDRGLAFVQLVFTLIAAGIPLFIFRLHWLERIFFVVILLGVLRVSVANGIESITLTRSEIASGREDHLASNQEWKTHIEDLTGQRKALKASFVPGGEKEYTPTSQAMVDTNREGRDAANRERDSACKTNRASNDCRTLTNQAETAQEKLEQVTQNYGLTLRIDVLERDIREAQVKLSAAGTAPPDYLGKARDALEGAWFNPLQNREMWTAYMAEGAAAGAPKLFVYIVSLLFAAALGENWWRESARAESAMQPDRESPQFKQESLSQPRLGPGRPIVQGPGLEPPSKPRKPFGSAYIPGFRAWMDTARPTPSGPRKRYKPSQAFPHYREFCEVKRFEPCKHVTTFGSLMKSYSELAPVAKTGGQSYYELNLGPKLALVKAGGEG